MHRRTFLHSSAAAGLLALRPGRLPGQAGAGGEGGLFELRRRFKDPVRISSIQLLQSGERSFLKTTSADGAAGISFPNERVRYLGEILDRLVIPYFVGKDARDLESLVDGVYTHQSNYKLAGLALWNCVGWVEFSLFDLLGKLAGKPVGDLLGGVIRGEVPVYLSSLRRDTTPEEEVAWLGKRLEETGAKAVKLKIGGRMSRNADASPGRTERLVPLARKTFGDGIAIYVDSNGSYDSRKAIEVGRMLEAHGVGFYEEPCPFDEYEETRRVAEALAVPVAGGEQDTSAARFEEMARRRVVDILQPDINYNGGFIRTARVARLAESERMPITPHSPATGPNIAYMLQFGSATRNIGPYLELNGAPRPREGWFTPWFEAKDGVVAVPRGPGLGVEVDPEVLRKAERSAGSAREAAAAGSFQVEEDGEEVRIASPELEARIRKKGYVSGVAEGSFLDRRTGFRDQGFGLDIVDWIMETGSDEAYRDRLPGDLPYLFNNAYHGRRAKRSIEGPQICTRAGAVAPLVIRGKDFLAVQMSYRYRLAAPGKRSGSIWDQTLVFPAGKRWFLSSDRITTVNASESMFLRVDLPGHIRHQKGDTFSEVYLSYHGRIPSSEFLNDFPPDERFLYLREEGKVPDRFIRAYRIRDPATGREGPWLAGMTLDPSAVHEAWCHQRGYVCLIEEFGGRPVRPGDSFSAAFIVGFFDSIEEMHRVYDEHKGKQLLEADPEGWRLVGPARS